MTGESDDTEGTHEIIQSDIRIAVFWSPRAMIFRRLETFKLLPRNYVNLKLQIVQSNGLRETLRTLGKLIRNLKTLRS